MEPIDPQRMNRKGFWWRTTGKCCDSLRFQKFGAVEQYQTKKGRVCEAAKVGVLSIWILFESFQIKKCQEMPFMPFLCVDECRWYKFWRDNFLHRLAMSWLAQLSKKRCSRRPRRPLPNRSVLGQPNMFIVVIWTGSTKTVWVKVWTKIGGIFF